jgi:hypothetical protein
VARVVHCQAGLAWHWVSRPPQSMLGPSACCSRLCQAPSAVSNYGKNVFTISQVSQHRHRNSYLHLSVPKRKSKTLSNRQDQVGWPTFVGADVSVSLKLFFFLLCALSMSHYGYLHLTRQQSSSTSSLSTNVFHSTHQSLHIGGVGHGDQLQSALPQLQ